MLAAARLILEASSLASPNDLIAKMTLSAGLIAAFGAGWSEMWSDDAVGVRV
ncbi:MAG: hypothetical protein L7U72_14735 [Rubripirellula sp.]|nr:hypothetical protein [Rubripirellula sp.]